MSEEALQQVQARLDDFRAGCGYAQLATLSDDGFPASSYAPCLVREDGVYVYLSQLSGHCGNLLRDPRAGVLLMADESQARNPFARQRVSYRCRAEVLAREAAGYDVLLDAMAERHGNTVALLRQLPDFVLFALRPVSGTYIEGFGKAFDLTGEGLRTLSHIDEQAIVKARR